MPNEPEQGDLGDDRHEPHEGDVTQQAPAPPPRRGGLQAIAESRDDDARGMIEAAFMAAALPYRSAGSRRSARRMISSVSRVISGFKRRGAGGSPTSRALAIAKGSSSSPKGGLPVSSS
jgi:hypothetical protein